MHGSRRMVAVEEGPACSCMQRYRMPRVLATSCSACMQCCVRLPCHGGMHACTLLSLAQPQSCCMRMTISVQLQCKLTSTHASCMRPCMHPQDVQWLGLTEGVDFAGMVDLAGVYRVYNTQYNSWTIFGQDHVVRDGARAL